MADKHKILIVDDEVNILNSLSRILEEEDREILVADSAEKADDILKNNKDTEVIICDNRMPKISGIDFLTKVKRLYPDTIRILLTGYPDLKTAMDAINKADIWRYILKPVEAEEIKVMIKQAFTYYRILKENRLLLQIAHQHADLMKMLREKHPLASEEVEKSSSYVFNEQYVSKIVEEFMKKYYTTSGEESSDK